MSTATSANALTEIITSEVDEVRNKSLDSICGDANLQTLLDLANELDGFWRSSDNLYHRVRAMFFLSAIHRFYAPGAARSLSFRTDSVRKLFTFARTAVH